VSLAPLLPCMNGLLLCIAAKHPWLKGILSFKHSSGMQILLLIDILIMPRYGVKVIIDTVILFKMLPIMTGGYIVYP